MKCLLKTANSKSSCKNLTLNVRYPMQRIPCTKIHLTNQYPIKDNYVYLK